ncbi:MAG: phenylacetate-CoA oxygenase subunit PaaJ [Chloroflexi bacterium]|nr:phenylacetate-CoA oxygenase subunit PaaJ [Chloroflexota bacterium]
MVMAAPRALTASLVTAALDGVADPEIPTVSIVELGMIGAIDVRPDAIEVELLPTFVGCPALEVIRDAATAGLAGLGREFGRAVRVEVSFATPWSSDRITPAGREKLRGSGFAPPPPSRPGRGLPMLDAAAAPVACPWCGSLRTTLENVFGPTQCRSIRHCPDCLQAFEAFKPV